MLRTGLIFSLLIYSVIGQLVINLVEDQNEFKYVTKNSPAPSDEDTETEKIIFSSEEGNAVHIGCKLWKISKNKEKCKSVKMIVSDLKTHSVKQFCEDDNCKDISFTSEGNETEVTFKFLKGNAIEWFAKAVKAATTTETPAITTGKPITTTTSEMTTGRTETTTHQADTTTEMEGSTTDLEEPTTVMAGTTTDMEESTTGMAESTTEMTESTTGMTETTTENTETSITNPIDDEYDAVRFINWTIHPGKPKIVVNPGYRQPAGGEGDINYNFKVKEGYGILASCDDDYRPSTNFERPCDVFTITFYDGDKKKRLCSHYWLSETFFITNRSQLSFQMNYTEGISSIVRCIFRSTEHLPNPTKILKVPKDSKIHSPKRNPFDENYYLIEGENGQPFNLKCHFINTETSHCVLSRVVIKVGGTEEVFCMSKDYSRRNITKAELYVSSDSNGWPEVYCNMAVGYTSEPDTRKWPCYGKKPRRYYINRREVRQNWTLKAGETREFGTKNVRRDENNVLVLDIEVSKGHKIYVFCDEYEPEYDGSLPCDPFSITMEEEGKAPEYWCSQRRLESLGYLSDGNNLQLTIESFSNNNRVTCAVRSTELPEPEVITLTDDSSSKILEAEKGEEYMVKRWLIKHEFENGRIEITCAQNILRSVYKGRGSHGIIKRQYYCLQRKIQVNDEVKCEQDVLNGTYLFQPHGKADIVIMSDKEGFNGQLCRIEGKF